MERERPVQSGSSDPLAKKATAAQQLRLKPRLRGVSHRYAFFGSLLPCVLLVLQAPSGRATLASALYAGSLVGLLGTSAVYHGINWSTRTRFWLGRLDLFMIFVLIAGTYTPIAMLRLDPEMASTVLAAVWGAAGVGGVVKTIWREPPKWVSAAIFVCVGSAALLFLPQVATAIGLPATLLMLLGGGLYIAGAVVYGLQRPDPVPAVFGYHEVFHLFVLAGAAVHFATIAFYVIPGSPGA
jgi:hemolysin III